ncbi:zinc dependent phospholipase C family protein [Methanobacterium sp. ACI-7]|uniref:zinc dependent phospholipase C family protein n=1 Tax=unclassified Methanobacterium TaxID=2627676 RepID=UPI0039C35DEA
MIKPLIMSLLLIGLFLTGIDAVSAWNWNTHQEIVESNYNSMPVNIKQNLNLDAMKEGSDDPDFRFLDFKYHGYPNSYGKAEEWLNKGQYYYKNGDYYYASYCYGVASHYITDTFSGPHSANYSGADHVLYETRASFLTPQVIQSSGDLSSSMSEGSLNGKSNWNRWLNSKDDSIIQNDLNKATSVSHNAIYGSISTSYSSTPVEEKKSLFQNSFSMLLISLI